MAANAGPDIIEDGIVFYYDTGNTVKSYVGEPTENLFGTTAMAFQSDYPDFTSYIQNGSDSIGNYIIKDTVNAPWYTGLRVRDNGVRPLTTGVPYVVSFECQSPQHGWSWSLDSNQYGGDWDGNDSGRTSFTNLTFISTGGTTYTQDMVNTWQKVQYVVYMKSWSGGSPTAYPLDSFFPDANNIKIYYRNPQMEVSKTHATQYTPTSRSATQGLLDMVRTSTINIANASFDNNAQIEFDGTNDYTDSGYDLSWNNTNSVSIEFMIKPYNLSGGGIMGKEYPNWEWAFYQSGTNLNLVYWNNAGGHSNGMDFQVNVFPTANTWYHITYTWDTTTSIFYVNGTAAGSKVAVDPSINQNRSNNVMIGGHTYVWADSYFNGKLDLVKYYNKALTASEVLTNYNALKTRFGI
jgi:hypothetical protein